MSPVMNKISLIAICGILIVALAMTEVEGSILPKSASVEHVHKPIFVNGNHSSVNSSPEFCHQCQLPECPNLCCGGAFNCCYLGESGCECCF